VVAAEITWLQSVISDLKSGSLTWSKDDMVSAVDAYKLD
jgi:hypothetical protein